MEKKHVFGLLGFILIIAVGIIFVNFGPNPPEKNTYKMPGPEDIVRQYFESWNTKDWPNMYAALSDGFKKIDPNAKDLDAFRKYAESQNIASIKIINIKLDSKTSTTATVSYIVEFTLAGGGTKQVLDKFTLKYRSGDVIPGWKLIHPYGPNIDTS